ncbi:hypothetical protein OD214_004606 [Salmonella enterica]|nr:hypothetical protein [Salmonella enterica]EJQ8218081.1 hypothetical protein [Salmonella enterica]EJX3181970.1 hypothetical protein [Salmonella enterica]EJX3291748.1 hypothetical protein [Salmonella enterica]EJX3310610.1 hypothetical protein [Salmonella enterica]
MKQGQYNNNASNKKSTKITACSSGQQSKTAGKHTVYAAIKSQYGQHKKQKSSCSASIRLITSLSRHGIHDEIRKIRH